MTTPADTTEKKISPALSRADLWPVAGILLVALVLYSPMFSGKPVMPDTWARFEPWNTELGYVGPLDNRIENSNNDAILLYIPWNAFAHRELNSGRIPAWDPYCLMGVPLASNHLVPVFYPVYTVIAWRVPPLFIMGVSGLIHTIVMAFFFYLFIREWLGNRLAAWMSASFLVISFIVNPHYQPWPMTLAWYPAIWFFYERWLKHRSGWSGLWMALCWACPLLAGYPSLVAQMSIFTAVWILVRPNMLPVEDRPNWKARLGILVWPFVLAVGLSAVQNVPTMMASMESDRTLFKSSEVLAREAAFTIPPNQPWQTHVKRILQPFIPFRFPGNDFFNRGFVGFLPVYFGFIGWLILFLKKRERILSWLTIVVGLFALIPALNFGVYWLTRGILIDPNPPLEVFGFLVLMLSAVGVKGASEFQEKIIRCMKDRKYHMFSAHLLKDGPDLYLGACVSGGFVLAFGLTMIMMYIDEKTVFFGSMGFMLPLIAALGFHNFIIFPIPTLNRKWYLVLVVFLLFSFSKFTTTEFIAPNTQYWAFTESPPQAESITTLISLNENTEDGTWGRIIRYHPEPVNVMSLDNQPYTFYPNLGTYFEIPDAFGYHNLAPQNRMDYFRAIQEDAVVENRGIVTFTGGEGGADPFDERLAMIGARFILTVVPLKGQEPIYSDEALFIYENPDAWSRAEFVGNVYHTDPETGETTVTEKRLGTVYDPDWPYVTADEIGHIVVNSSADVIKPGKVIINEAYSAGWRAYVDGTPTPIFQHDDLLIGVDLTDNCYWNSVELKYYMPGLILGWWITGLSLFIWLIIALGFSIRSTGTKR